MARARNIKPGLFKNEVLAELDPSVRLLFIGLWTLADREGRIEDRPKRIKLELLPYDSVDVDDMLDQLCQDGFIDRYEAAGKKVIQVVAFLKHQNPHGTEKDSELPDRNGEFTVHERARNGCVTGVKRSSNVENPKNNVKTDRNNVIPTLSHSALTVNPPLDNALNPDSLNPDSLNPEEYIAAPVGSAQSPPKKSASTSTVTRPPDVEQSVFEDFLKIRKAKRSPLTQTALEGIAKQALLAGISLNDALRMCCERGWQGFNAEWVEDKTPKPARPKKTAHMGFDDMDYTQGVTEDGQLV